MDREEDLGPGGIWGRVQGAGSDPWGTRSQPWGRFHPRAACFLVEFYVNGDLGAIDNYKSFTAKQHQPHFTFQALHHTGFLVEVFVPYLSEQFPKHFLQLSRHLAHTQSCSNKYTLTHCFFPPWCEVSVTCCIAAIKSMSTTVPSQHANLQWIANKSESSAVIGEIPFVVIWNTSWRSN